MNTTEIHLCHWPGCKKEVPPAMWGCQTHWFKIPAHLRSRLWAAYREGQEIDKNPSEEYIAIAKDIQDWIRTKNA